ncbi:MAG: twin-arginine translocase TatA/TatE family subunit [Eggerthellaceae bacterium]|nr:twin-arginine translocase TatA/TatE family subunit [Eggerthellaceae bacterium]
MKILGMGVPELVVILIIVLLIFGPKNLPKLGNAIGKGIKGLRKGMEDGESETKKDADAEEAVVEKVEKLEAADVDNGPIEEGEPKRVVKRVVKKKVAEEVE